MRQRRSLLASHNRALIPVSRRFEQHIRDYMVIEYADLLLSTPEYWNIACNYLATAGETGIGRMRSVLLHVGLRDPSLASSIQGGTDDMVVDQDAEQGDDADQHNDLEKVESVLRAAEEYRLEGVTKEICRVSTRHDPVEALGAHPESDRSCPSGCSVNAGLELLSRFRCEQVTSGSCA